MKTNTVLCNIRLFKAAKFGIKLKNKLIHALIYLNLKTSLLYNNNYGIRY